MYRSPSGLQPPSYLLIPLLYSGEESKTAGLTVTITHTSTHLFSYCFYLLVFFCNSCSKDGDIYLLVFF